MKKLHDIPHYCKDIVLTGKIQSGQVQSVTSRIFLVILFIKTKQYTKKSQTIAESSPRNLTNILIKRSKSRLPKFIIVIYLCTCFVLWMFLSTNYCNHSICYC